MGIFNIPRVRKVNGYANAIATTKSPKDFKHLLNININDIVLFEDSKEDEDYTNRIVLPRHHSVFVGNKDGELQFKPYEYDQYRIVVSTYNNVITSIISIG